MSDMKPERDLVEQLRDLATQLEKTSWRNDTINTISTPLRTVANELERLEARYHALATDEKAAVVECNHLWTELVSCTLKKAELRKESEAVAAERDQLKARVKELEREASR